LRKLTKDRSVLLDKLISDCITFRLSVDESLEYIKRQFGEIKRRQFFRRKKRLLSEGNTMEWCSDFARIGFVEQHKKVCLDLEMILDDSLHRLFEEKQKPPKERDDHLILLLKKDIRAGTLAFQEMSMGTPIMAELKGMLDKRAHSLNPSAAEVYPHYRKLLNQL